MDRVAIAKGMPKVIFAEVVKEMKLRYPGVNIKTASMQFVNLMELAIKYHPEENCLPKFKAKLNLAVLVSDCFTQSRKN